MADFYERYHTLDIRFRCGGCVRFTENHREPGHFNCCAYNNGRGEITADTIACLEYWDAKREGKREEAHQAAQERKRRKLWKQNARKAPVPCVWEDDFDGMTDTLRKAFLPTCPECGNPLFDSPERCEYCGMPILPDEKLLEWFKPPEIEHMDCHSCGGKGTVEVFRAKINGHKHGCCTQCGRFFME